MPPITRNRVAHQPRDSNDLQVPLRWYTDLLVEKTALNIEKTELTKLLKIAQKNVRLFEYLFT